MQGRCEGKGVAMLLQRWQVSGGAPTQALSSTNVVIVCPLVKLPISIKQIHLCCRLSRDLNRDLITSREINRD